MDLEGVVKLVSLHVQVLFDVAEGVMTDVEVARDAKGFNEALDAAALFISKLSLDSVCDFLSVSDFLGPSLR